MLEGIETEALLIWFVRAYNSSDGNALVNPFNRQALDSEHSFSVIAPTAYVADALTKVVAISQNPQHPCLKVFAAQAVIF